MPQAEALPPDPLLPAEASGVEDAVPAATVAQLLGEEVPQPPPDPLALPLALPPGVPEGESSGEEEPGPGEGVGESVAARGVAEEQPLPVLTAVGEADNCGLCDSEGSAVLVALPRGEADSEAGGVGGDVRVEQGEGGLLKVPGVVPESAPLGVGGEVAGGEVEGVAVSCDEPVSMPEELGVRVTSKENENPAEVEGGALKRAVAVAQGGAVCVMAAAVGVPPAVPPAVRDAASTVGVPLPPLSVPLPLPVGQLELAQDALPARDAE